MAKNNYQILSVGGSIVIPKTGFDIPFLKKFRTLILTRVKRGEKFVLVIGGGGTCRAYQEAAKAVVPLTSVDLDWLGIHTTHFNAEFVRLLFAAVAYKEVVKNPTLPLKTKKPVIVAGGWQPGCSTDYDAVLLAKQFGAKTLLNLSNIDYVYTKDPRKFPDAKKIEMVDWGNFQKIVGTKWTPGANVPFDPKATVLAKQLALTVKFVRGTDLGEVGRAIDGKSFQGSIITPNITG